MPAVIEVPQHFNSKTITIKTLRRKWKQGKLFLRPVIGPDGKRTFQRLPHWKRGQKIYLIHSIYDGTTLPPIYYLEDDDGNIYIIDGQQRLSTIFEFLESELRLTEKGMIEKNVEKLHPDLNNKTFEKMSEEQQKGILYYKLRVESVDRDEVEDEDLDEVVRYDFHRYNATNGSMTAMEIKNSTFSGDMIDVLFNIQSRLGFVPMDDKATAVKDEQLENYILLDMGVVSRTEVLRLQDLDLILQLVYMMEKQESQHKEDGIAEFCREHQEMEDWHKQKLEDDFLENIKIIQKMMHDSPLGQSFAKGELHKKHDFYGLFAAVNQLRGEDVLSSDENMAVEGKNLDIFSLAVRSYIEQTIENTARHYAPKWGRLKIVSTVKKAVPDYVYSKTRDWNTKKCRELRANLIESILRRSRTIAR